MRATNDCIFTDFCQQCIGCDSCEKYIPEDSERGHEIGRTYWRKIREAIKPVYEWMESVRDGDK